MAWVKEKITLTLLKRSLDQIGMIFMDTEIIGFQARVGKNGIVFYVRKKIDGRIYTKSLGRWPEMVLDDARRDAMKYISSVVNFEIAAPVAASKQPTLGEAMELFIRRVKQPANARSVFRYLSHLENKKIVELSRSDIVAVLNNLKDKKATSNQLLAYFQSCIHGISKTLGIDLPNPASGLSKYRLDPRKRFLSETEAPRLMEALQKLTRQPINGIQAQALLMMIYTGQRKSNVLQMNLSEIDERGVWTVPHGKSKSGKEIIVPLNEYAMEIVRQLTPGAMNGFLFCWRGKPMQEVRKTMTRACEMAGVENCHVHDLRRTLGSWMLMNGTPIEVVSRTLGHSSIAITEQVYAHLLPKKISDATSSAIGAMLKGKV